MSSKRDTINAYVNDLPRDDLLDLYEKLAEAYRSLKTENEENKQKNHFHKQQMKVLQRSQIDLQSELDGINEIHKQKIEAIVKQNISAVESLKNARQEIENDKNLLEAKIDELNLLLAEKENEQAQQKLKSETPKPRISDTFSLNLEIEVESLHRELKEVQEKMNLVVQQNLEKNQQVEELREKIYCLDDNLESKKLELEEKNEAIESLQEQLHEMTVELVMLKSTPEDANRKGNSLFAEVDDQRQKMKTILQGERAHYNDMKKLFNSKEIEIRRLKRENCNIKTEIQTCSGLLQRGEQIEVQTLNAQVTFLHNENRKLLKELMEMEKKLVDLANEQNLGWIESLMTSASTETRDLKEKLMQVMIEKASLVDIFAKSQKELSKARLDCVKLKILLGRIVEANSIKINENDFLDIGVDQEVLENLKNDEFKIFDIPKTTENHNEELNESTIVLIGGRERLGKFNPQESSKIEKKENFLLASKPPLVPGAQVLKDHQENCESSEKEAKKSIKFSNKVEMKMIDKTPEEFQQSNQARKRNPIVVKRIIIASKPSVKKAE